MRRLLTLILILFASITSAAEPTIFFDNAGVNPPSASGAGPATALTGTNTTWATNVVTLDGTPNLSGVLADGSHAIYISTTTGRRFYKITAVDDTADTVTTSVNVTGTSGQSWAIGGKLGSMANANAAVLFNNGAAVGDWSTGWIVELADGYTETFSSEFGFYSSTDLWPLLRGASGAVTRPVLTTTATTGDGFDFGGGASAWMRVEDIDFTGGVGATLTSLVRTGTRCQVRRCRLLFGSATSVSVLASLGGAPVADNTRWEHCYFDGNDSANGISGTSTGSTGHNIYNCLFKDTNQGIDLGGSSANIRGCIFVSCTTAIDISQNFDDVSHNTIDDCVNGFIFSASITILSPDLTVRNNVLAHISGNAINFSNADVTGVILSERGFGAGVSNNAFFSITGEKLNTGGDAGDQVAILEDTVNPGATPFVETTIATRKTNLDWRLNTEVKALGFPLTQIGGVTGTRNFVDIGAAQREEPIGGGTVANQAVAVGF